MRKYTTARLVQSVPLILVIIALNWFIMHAAPGDPVSFLVSGEEMMPPGYVEVLRARYGLDKPLYVQFLKYLANVLQGDFGFSYYYLESVWTVVIRNLPRTILLTATAFLFSLIIGVFAGVVSAKKPYSISDNVATATSLVVWSMPFFWMGMLGIMLFTFRLNLFPVQGMKTVGTHGLAEFFDITWHLFVPALMFGLGQFALYSRFTRASMLEVMKQDYILTARSKGLAENDVVYGHALRNALLPLVTLVGLRIAYLFTGSILIETVFSWPGLGTILIDSITRRDYTLLMAIFVIFSLLVIICNLAADLAYAYLDPRIRYR